MLKLTGRYATALLEYAEENGIEDIYRQALVLLSDKSLYEGKNEIPGTLGQFLAQVPRDDIKAILYRFLDLARQHMNLLDAEVISAVELTQQQLADIEARLIRMFQKQIDMTATVDPSILGGLRIIVGSTVLDNTIKRKLQDMKNIVYTGVYFRQ